MISPSLSNSASHDRKVTHTINEEALAKATGKRVARTRAANVQTVAEPTTTAQDAPECVLTPDANAQWMARAVGLSGNDLGVVPARLPARITWMRKIYTVAWRDRSLLASIEVPGSALTEKDVHDFGYAITFLSDASADRGAPRSKDADSGLAALPEAELHMQMQTKRLAVCDGLMLVFADEPTERAEVRVIRSKRGRGMQTETNNKLFRACKAKVVGRLRKLPNHPDVALNELRLLDAEWGRRTRRSAQGPIDLVARAYHLAATYIRAIRVRTDYLVKVGLGARAEYPTFKARAVRKQKAANAPIATPPAPTPIHT